MIIGVNDMNPFVRRILPFVICLLIACLYTVTAYAGQTTEASTQAETNTKQPSRYGRGYEARHGLDHGERVERIERIERVERVERPERPEQPDRPERPQRPERVERIDRGR